MTEFILRDILKDWVATLGLTSAFTERDDADTALRSELTDVTEYDAYDKAMTYIEKRIGKTLPTTEDMFDLLLELGAKLWLCARVLARELPNIDVNNKKSSNIYKNVKDEHTRLNEEFKEIRQEIWGEGKRSSRTTTGDLEIITMSSVSNRLTEIEDGDMLELDT